MRWVPSGPNLRFRYFPCRNGSFFPLDLCSLRQARLPGLETSPEHLHIFPSERMQKKLPFLMPSETPLESGSWPRAHVLPFRPDHRQVQSSPCWSRGEKLPSHGSCGHGQGTVGWAQGCPLDMALLLWQSTPPPPRQRPPHQGSPMASWVWWRWRHSYQCPALHSPHPCSKDSEASCPGPPGSKVTTPVLTTLPQSHRAVGCRHALGFSLLYVSLQRGTCCSSPSGLSQTAPLAPRGSVQLSPRESPLHMLHLLAVSGLITWSGGGMG